jgi:hypothetical protein
MLLGSHFPGRRILEYESGRGPRLAEKSDKLHLKPMAVFFIAAAILILRRPDHILLPAAWNEDGTLVLPELLNRGWQSIIWRESGYLIIPSRVLSALALAISFSHYALVAIPLSLIAQSACVAAIASAPSHLPAPSLCAVMAVLIPTDPEVLLTPLYVFRWTGLLALSRFALAQRSCASTQNSLHRSRRPIVPTYRFCLGAFCRQSHSRQEALQSHRGCVRAGLCGTAEREYAPRHGPATQLFD